MQAIIRYPNGQRSEVLVLSAGKFEMRIISQGDSDSVELTCTYGEWTDEAGVQIQFDSLVANGEDDVRVVLRMTAEHSRAAS